MNTSALLRSRDPRLHPRNVGAASAMMVAMITITRINSINVKPHCFRRWVMDELLLLPLRPVVDVVVAFCAVGAGGEHVIAVDVVRAWITVLIRMLPRIQRNGFDVRAMPALHARWWSEERLQALFAGGVSAA